MKYRIEKTNGVDSYSVTLENRWEVAKYLLNHQDGYNYEVFEIRSILHNDKAFFDNGIEILDRMKYRAVGVQVINKECSTFSETFSTTKDLNTWLKGKEITFIKIIQNGEEVTLEDIHVPSNS